ncbi:MAG: DUF2157 domain-containing protein [Planctomycetota bacterium]
MLAALRERASNAGSREPATPCRPDGALGFDTGFAVVIKAPPAQAGAVGALLIGTGLIAVLASNWDDFPRWVRLVLALGPLAVTQAVSWWVLRKDETARPWQREAAALAQTLAVGTAMTLVSQIYNLPGKWTDLVFWWCVASVALAWVLRSQAVAIASLLGIRRRGPPPGRAGHPQRHHDRRHVDSGARQATGQVSPRLAAALPCRCA